MRTITHTESPTVPVLLLGTVTGATEEGLPLVQPDGADAAEACSVVWLGSQLSWEHCAGLRVACQPLAKGGLLVTALMEAPPAGGIIQTSAAGSQPSQGAGPHGPQGPLHLENDKEIVLRCGKAKVALRADGRIEIIGGYLISRARKVNKIQGGSVQIN